MALPTMSTKSYFWKDSDMRRITQRLICQMSPLIVMITNKNTSNSYSSGETAPDLISFTIFAAFDHRLF